MDSLLDFDVTHAKSLEDCLNSQTIGRIPYDLANNKALLKYYQVNPSVADLDNVANILLLALMELPNTFYLASSYLVPSKFWSNPKISSIKIIADKLERAQYAEFWEIVTRESETFSTVREFSTKIRQYIASCLRETYKSVSLSTFKSFTNITSDSELAAIPFIEVIILDLFLFYTGTNYVHINGLFSVGKRRYSSFSVYRGSERKSQRSLPIG